MTIEDNTVVNISDFADDGVVFKNQPVGNDIQVTLNAGESYTISAYFSETLDNVIWVNGTSVSYTHLTLPTNDQV